MRVLSGSGLPHKLLSHPARTIAARSNLRTPQAPPHPLLADRGGWDETFEALVVRIVAD